MKIGIDARLIEETGVGRYIRNLMGQLGEFDKTNEYVVFLSKKSYDSFICPNARWQKRLVDVRWHSFQEQFVMPGVYGKEQLDIVHIPYFNVPIFYRGRFIPTIHDLIILSHATGKATLLPGWLYQIKRLGYRIVLEHAMRRSAHILTVSETVKQHIEQHFAIPGSKITVTYEGVDPQLTVHSAKVKVDPIQGPYFLYVGNAYPHKNVETIIKAFDRSLVQAKLILVGKEDFFYKQLKERVSALQRSSDIVFLHQVSDAELHALYAHATALLSPSLDEGFGLPPLEALATGTRVVVSDIPIFHEILSTLPIFVSPQNVASWTRAMEQVVKEKKKSDFGKKAQQWVARYSWRTLAKKTLAVYESV